MQVTGAEFENAIAPLFKGAIPERLAVAVSGGPDSMALAFCLNRWAAPRAIAVKAYIVDHHLRPESSTEAQKTFETLHRMGISAEILTWDHPPIVSRIESEARNARYALLGEACRKNKIPYLLVAHQKNDQAETILMRLTKGSGPAGLSGMAPICPRDGYLLLRPMLNFSKERLIATCVAANIPFATDPTNRSADFARGRLRRIEELLAVEGLSVDRLVDLGERARESHEALDSIAVDYFSEKIARDKAGVFRIDRAGFQKLPIALAARVLIYCMQSTSPHPYPPERSSLSPIVHRLWSQDAVGCTLRGCMIRGTSKNILVLREASAITEVAPIRAGETVVWDHRWKLTLDVSVKETNLEIRALGMQRHDSIDALSPRLRHDIPMGKARATLPCLWKNGIPFGLPDSFGNSVGCTASLCHYQPPFFHNYNNGA
jgi:tRNA(Ile)-lysidine synthase